MPIIDISRELTTATPYAGDPAPRMHALATHEQDGYQLQAVVMSLHAATHVDAPRHFWANGRALDAIEPIDLVMPLCVIDRHRECAADPDFVLTVDDLIAWEAAHGRIPAGAFVAFRSDWSRKTDLENKDSAGKPHYPGWDLDAVTWLVEQRGIGAIGHEPADTDPACVTTRAGFYPYPAERYILAQDRFQIEVMNHLDMVPETGALIVCAFPKLLDGVGYPARCFAICPVEA